MSRAKRLVEGLVDGSEQFSRWLIEMRGEQIAQILGTSRQYVSQTLKSAMVKVYTKVAEEFPEKSPTEIVALLADALSIDQEDIGVFIRLLPKEAKEDIEKAGAERKAKAAARKKKPKRIGGEQDPNDIDLWKPPSKDEEDGEDEDDTF